MRYVRLCVFHGMYYSVILLFIQYKRYNMLFNLSCVYYNKRVY